METDPLVRKEIWAYGFRNPHRMCWDLTHGNRMLVADIGESNIEEINIVEKGGDYGWSTVEGTYGISTKTNLTIVYPLSKSELELYNAPFGQYDHNDGNAISGGFVYQGPYRVLQDKYFFGDIVNGKLLYMNLDQQLTDSSVYEIAIVENGLETNLKEISHSNRVHLRIGYDLYSGQLFIMTKGDGKIRRVASAYNKEDEI